MRHRIIRSWQPSPGPIIAVPNVRAHRSTASVSITVLLYYGPLLCDFNVAIKGLSNWITIEHSSLYGSWYRWFCCRTHPCGDILVSNKHCIQNKYIGDDTKAAPRQSLNCIKNQKNKIWRRTIFNMTDWNSYTLQCGTILTLISPGDCTLRCGMWLWNRDSEFTKWQHPTMWYVALGWHATEFAQTNPPYWRFLPQHRSQYVILHQSPKFYSNWTTLGRKKWRHVDFQDGGSQPCWILGIQ